MKEEQWKVAHVTHDGRIVHNSVLKMQLMSEALKRGYDETAEITGYQYLQTVYTENEDEYLVSGAQLKCTMATTEKMTIEGREYIPENPSEITYLECEENLMESGEGKVNATTKDCVVYKNIKPFRCNCKVKPCSEEEKDMLLTDESCLTEGTCKAFIDLNGSWENYPAETPHFEYEDERFGKVSGITMMSMLFCKHGGLITPVTSGQEVTMNDFIDLELSINPLALKNTRLQQASTITSSTQGKIQTLCKANGTVYFDEDGYQRVKNTGLNSDPYLVALGEYYMTAAMEMEMGDEQGFGALYKVTLSSEKEIYITVGDAKNTDHTKEAMALEGKNYYEGEGKQAHTLEFICNFENRNGNFPASDNMKGNKGTDANMGQAITIMEGASIIKIELFLDYDIDWESHFEERN